MSTMSRHNPAFPGKEALRRLPVPPVALLALLGVLIPLLGYGILPLLGVGAFGNLFSLNRFFLGILGVVGAFGYWHYLRFIIPRPQWITHFYLSGWLMAEYGNNTLMDLGVNLHMRPLMVLTLGVPAAWYGYKYCWSYLKTLPYLKYYAAFTLLVLAYFLFNNANATDARHSGGDSPWSEGSIGMLQITNYFYILFGILLGAIGILRHPDPKRCFDQFNMVLLSVSAVVAIVTLVGFPFGVFGQNIDGFMRAQGLFTHPNPYAHHMGILMVYLLGLFCYYQGPLKDRVPGWLLVGGIGFNLAAFLIGLSKTALGCFTFCALLLFLLNLSSPVVRRSFFKVLLILAILAPIGVFAFEKVMDRSLFELIEARINDTHSMNWRNDIWSVLLASISGAELLFGHGFTAANAVVFQFTYNTLTNAKPLMLVHNGYVSLLYDFGLPGMLLFVAVLSLFFNSIGLARRPDALLTRPLLVTILAMSVYFLVVCAFDEMIYMFDAPLLFWVLTTVMYCLTLREVGE